MSFQFGYVAPAPLKPGSNTLIVGKFNKGTTTLISSFLETMKDSCIIVVMTSVDSEKEMYRKITKSEFVTDFDRERLSAIFEMQKFRKISGVEPDHIVIVIDTQGQQIFRDNLITKMIVNGRHYNISFVFIAPFVKDMNNVAARNNIDTFVCPPYSMNETDIKDIWSVIGKHGRLDDVLNVARRVAKASYSFLVFDRTVKDIERYINWTKVYLSSSNNNQGHILTEKESDSMKIYGIGPQSPEDAAKGVDMSERDRAVQDFIKLANAPDALFGLFSQNTAPVDNHCNGDLVLSSINDE